MNFTLIIAGLFFILNPNVHLIDILPDFIGCILILRGLYPRAVINDSLGTSYKYFNRLLILNLLKIPALILCLAQTGNDQVWTLLFSSGFGIFEIWFSVKAFNEMFDGMLFAAMLPPENEENGASAGEKPLPAAKSFDELRAFTAVFLIAKVLLYIIPELTKLANGEYGVVTADGVRSLADYRNYFVVISCLLGLIIGIVWFIKIYGYMKGLSDASFIKQTDDKYNAIISEKPFLPIQRSLFSFFSLITLGAVLSLGFRLDGITRLPYALGGILFVFALFSAKKIYGKSTDTCLIAASSFSLISVITFAYQYYFIYSFFGIYLNDSSEGLSFSFSEVLKESITRSIDTLYSFYASVALAAVEGLLFIFFIYTVYKIIMKIITEHTGKTVAGFEDDTARERENAGSITTSALTRLLKITTAAGFVSGAVMLTSGYLTVYMPAFWVIELTSKGLWTVLTVVLVSKIKDAVKNKYYL